MALDDLNWHDQLRDRGFFVVPDAYDPYLLVRLRHRFENLDRCDLTPEQMAETGTFIPMDLADELTVQVLTWPRIWQVLADLGWSRPKLHSFYVTAKPPGADALPWHCDVFYPAPGPTPTELFVLMYLQDTSPANGCLRVVPGSHLSDDALNAARHTRGSATASTRLDEVDVAVRAGDLIIADRRLLHATHPNQTSQWRTGLTIAVAPAFDALPEAVQARIVANPCLPRPGCWWATEDIDARLRLLLPRYDGSAEPVPIG